MCIKVRFVGQNRTVADLDCEESITLNQTDEAGSRNTYCTFLAVVLVIVQHEAAAALAAVASEGVHTFVLAASVFFGALIYIC